MKKKDKMSVQELLKSVVDVELSTKHLVDGLITGNYHSVFKGQGVDFTEIKEYKPGDDIRSIDWNVTARFDKPYVKEFIEERDLRIYFFVDVSSSGSFGDKLAKKQRALEIAASLMFAALKNNDLISLLLGTTKIEHYVPLRKGKRHTLHCIHEMLHFKTQEKKTDLHACFKDLNNMLKRRSIIFLISDFVSKSYFEPLSHLSKKHDVIAINVLDKHELELPNVGYIELEDPETGEQLLVDTSDQELRDAYHTSIHKHYKLFYRECQKYKVDTITLFTQNDIVQPLKHFFNKRGRY